MKYAGDAERLSGLEGVDEEIEMYRAHGDDYGYAFFVVRPLFLKANIP